MCGESSDNDYQDPGFQAESQARHYGRDRAQHLIVESESRGREHRREQNASQHESSPIQVEGNFFAIVIAETRFRLDAGKERNDPCMRPLFLEHGHLVLERQSFKD